MLFLGGWVDVTPTIFQDCMNSFLSSPTCNPLGLGRLNCGRVPSWESAKSFVAWKPRAVQTQLRSSFHLLSTLLWPWRSFARCPPLGRQMRRVRWSSFKSSQAMPPRRWKPRKIRCQKKWWPRLRRRWRTGTSLCLFITIIFVCLCVNVFSIYQQWFIKTQWRMAGSRTSLELGAAVRSSKMQCVCHHRNPPQREKLVVTKMRVCLLPKKGRKRPRESVWLIRIDLTLPMCKSLGWSGCAARNPSETRWLGRCIARFR